MPPLPISPDFVFLSTVLFLSTSCSIQGTDRTDSWQIFTEFDKKNIALELLFQALMENVDVSLCFASKVAAVMYTVRGGQRF